MTESRTLVETCPECGRSENHACPSFLVDSFATARAKAAREIHATDLCRFCEERAAVADTPLGDAICAGCEQIRKVNHPEREPCVPRLQDSSADAVTPSADEIRS